MSLIKEEQNNSPLKLWCSRGPSIYNQDSDGADLLEYDWEGIDTKIESEVFYYEENIENDNLSNFVRKIFIPSILHQSSYFLTRIISSFSFFTNRNIGIYRRRNKKYKYKLKYPHAGAGKRVQF